jgi:phage terminase large subunit
VWHRKSGKDLTWWNFMILRAVEKVGLYWYIFPTLEQAKKAIWYGFSNESVGLKYLDHIPRELIASVNHSDFRIELVNGSIIQLIGSDRTDSIVGPNPVGIVLSEFAIQFPDAWELLSPILEQNRGWSAFNSTPRGRNHLYKLYSDIALRDPIRWFADMKSISQTRRDAPGEDGGPIIGEEQLELIRREHDADYVEQEYMCSFTGAHAGSYVGRVISDIRARNQVRDVPWDPSLPVFTSWDLGVADATAIWFAQVLGREIWLIDYVEVQGQGLPYFAREIHNRPYVYSTHWAPHDIEVRDFSTGMSRRQLAQQLGINFRVIPKLPIQDGIDAVRAVLPRCYFDRVKCDLGLRALENYSHEWNPKAGEYKSWPMHDKWTHGADAMRGLALIVEREGSSSFQQTVVEKDFAIFDDSPRGLR